LAAVQGNILKGHGRDHQRFIFFRFGSRAEGLKLLRESAAAGGTLGTDRWVCSALNQRDQRDVHYSAWSAQQTLMDPSVQFTDFDRNFLLARINLAQTQIFSSLMLSLAGLEFLGLTPPPSDAFAAGMKARMATMLKTDEMKEAPYHPDGGIHGMFLLACEDSTTLDNTIPALDFWCRKHETTLLKPYETGFTWRAPGNPYGNGYRPPREPFGFADGISQPLFFADQRTSPAMRQNQPTSDAWTTAGLEQVFLREPGHEGGSLVALLKIEQKVATFRKYEQDLADLLQKKLGLAADQASYVAPAVLMGRTREGYPLHEVIKPLPPTAQGLRALFPAGPAAPGPNDPPPPPPSWLNEFDFEPPSGATQPATRGCPFHMHMRKMNPRVSQSPHGNRDSFVAAQFVRRGTTYDPKGLLVAAEVAGGKNWPDKEVGLLFLAYMSDLSSQFETLHTFWSTDWTFPELGGIDPVLARPDPDPQKAPPSFKFGAATIPLTPSILRRLGGVYLYAPSLPWLQHAGLPR